VCDVYVSETASNTTFVNRCSVAIVASHPACDVDVSETTSNEPSETSLRHQRTAASPSSRHPRDAGSQAHDATVVRWERRERQGSIAAVDFVVQVGRRIAAIEVKSGRRREAMPGLAAFIQVEPSARPFVVGADGIPLEQALTLPVKEWISV
jgi:hypothetical protein